MRKTHPSDPTPNWDSRNPATPNNPNPANPNNPNPANNPEGFTTNADGTRNYQDGTRHDGVRNDGVRNDDFRTNPDGTRTFPDGTPVPTHYPDGRIADPNQAVNPQGRPITPAPPTDPEAIQQKADRERRAIANDQPQKFAACAAEATKIRGLLNRPHYTEAELHAQLRTTAAFLDTLV